MSDDKKPKIQKIIYGKENIDVDWWTLDKNASHAHIFDQAVDIQRKSSLRMDKNNRCLLLYGNYNLTFTDPASYLRSSSPIMPETRVKLNIAASMSDTVCAKISKMKPRVTFLTDEGDFNSQTQAKKLTKFIDGAFYKNKIYELHQTGFRDCTVFDAGILKHYISQDKTIITERVLPNELLVDDHDAAYGSPRSIYQVKMIRKDLLNAMYPKKQALVEVSSPSLTSKFQSMDQTKTSSYVAVIETWHLPSSKDSGDGRHVICTDKVSLLDEEYDKDYFPFTFFSWSKPHMGFFGQSLVERLMGNQIEINKMLRIIQRSFHLGSAFKVFLEYGSKVAKDHINNEIGSIVYYAGSKPEFYVPQVVHPEYFQHLQFLIKASYEEAGISQLSASSKLPAGIDGGSGKAIREYNDLETERFVLIAQMYEASFLQTAEIYVDLAKDIKEMGGDMKVVAQSKQFIESIKWSEIDLENDNYIMQMFPTNSLPHTPSGRLAYVQELVNNGYIDRAAARDLLDFPDIDENGSLENAAIQDLRRDLYDILESKEFRIPEPYQNLQYGMKLFQAAYLRARSRNAPTKILDNLQRWMTLANQLIQTAAQPIAQQQAMGQMPAQPGLPAAQPQQPSPQVAGPNPVPPQTP